MAYVSFRSELDTNALLTQAWKDQRRVLLPRVIPASGAMSVHRVSAWSELEPGAYGIHEPIVSGKDSQEIEVVTLPEVVFVPGLAFDLQGVGLVTAEDTMIDCVRHGRRKSMPLRSRLSGSG